MAGRLMTNFAQALDERAADLASAPDPQSVSTIVQQAREEAVRRSEVPNTLVYQITVVVLGLSVLLVIGAQLWITLDEGADAIPEGLIAIGAAAIGALAGLLAPTPAS
jgi:hypothetical protein